MTVAGPNIAATLIAERGEGVAGQVGKTGGAARSARYRMRRAGLSCLPRWRWTASDDKALIHFMRSHDAALPDFWDMAGAVLGARGAWRTYVRATELRRVGAPMPPIPPRPLTPSERERPSRGRVRIWTDDRFAELLALTREIGCVRAAEQMGTTIHAVYNVLRRKTARAKRPGMPRARLARKQDDADAAFAARAWAEFEASQPKEERKQS